MKCESIYHMLGYECREVKTLWHETAIAVDTPFSFSDGEAIGFYLIPDSPGNNARITDNGDTIAHLINMGLSHADGRRWSSLRHRLEPHGCSITKEGAVFSVGPKKNLDDLVASYLAGVLSIAEYENDALSTPGDTNVFIEEVGMLIRAWKPNSKVSVNPMIIGQSRRKHQFDYLVDGILIDAISPHANASGSLMRKAGDVISSPEVEDMSIMAIIDDRFDPKAAKTEQNIISTLVRSALYSRMSEKILPEGPGTSH